MFCRGSGATLSWLGLRGPTIAQDAPHSAEIGRWCNCKSRLVYQQSTLALEIGFCIFAASSNQWKLKKESLLAYVFMSMVNRFSSIFRRYLSTAGRRPPSNCISVRNPGLHPAAAGCPPEYQPTNYAFPNMISSLGHVCSNDSRFYEKPNQIIAIATW